ncbi:putative eukaryotic translation initiation factor subunit eIF-4F [Emericellopsis atlantica]|uniref:Eukaryotic translation initiation factor subunit eIF-4F n=1 Tax=Emericellopsis atlantica TaxID=2614577 RepID=A0A9P7ZNA8_9HYPO|nr:putative eukaryotic translation initiation factor subunit eIF-4F [Emericellopsis atlantica]KAG9255175.1 putative eukaryotic translation initiation factor subunit eIF-4F [Emericellopsis atlantica]
MTSPANQQNPPATNTSAPSASYASAAGAPQKSSQNQPPVNASGSQDSTTVGTSASPAQNAKSASPAPVNGKPAVNPAIPAAPRGPSHGAHSRQTSVTMATNGPSSFAANGGHAAAAKSNIQFGFGSPSAAHGSPQAPNAAPIPIPGNNGNPRVASPAHSPSPIPQPSASGGRPPSGLSQAGGQQMTFGSLGSDGDRHMRQGSVPPNPNVTASQQPGTHFRRDSHNSNYSEGRPNFNQGGRGRGFNPHNNFNNNQMGFPPNNFNRNGPAQGRGMPPAFQPQGPRNMGYPNSPQPAHRSPAMHNAIPGNSMPGTPNMPPAQMGGPMPMHGGQPGFNPYNAGMPQQQVHLPHMQTYKKPFFKAPPKKAKFRRDTDRSSQMSGRSEGLREHPNFDNYAQPPRSRRHDERFGRDNSWVGAEMEQARNLSDSHLEKSPTQYSCIPHHLPEHITAHPPALKPGPPSSIDLSPCGRNFEQYLLTCKKGYGGYGAQADHYGRPYGNYQAPYMGHANSPGFNPAFAASPQYHHQSHSMSRTPSQPERPASASQQGGPVVVGGSNSKQGTPSQANADIFSKPGKKSAALVIKSSSGEVLDTSTFKAPPASPAPSSQQTKTPPVASSTSTPPPKPSTPAGHGRTDSHAVQKSVKEIQEELKEKIRLATAKDAPKAGSATEAKPTESAPAKTEEKPTEKPAAEAQPPVEPAEAKKAEPEKPAESNAEPDEDEIERMIREMEEEDARREAAEEEHRKKAEAKKAAEKEQAEKNRLANAAEEDRKLREQEREMERLEEEKERKRAEAEKSGQSASASDLLEGNTAAAKEAETSKVDSVTDKLAGMKLDAKPAAGEKRGKPSALNLAPLKTSAVEPAQPSAALQSLKSARFLRVMDQDMYPEGIKSPNPALNAAVATKGKTFKYDANFLLQFQKVFTEQPSTEFHQQVKTLMGDNESRSGRAQTLGARQPSGRGGNAFQMGAFNAGSSSGGRAQPGSTSAERFAKSQSGTLPRPGTSSMNSFRAPGNFPMGQPMSRQASNNMGGSGRQGSRKPSRKGNDAKEAQAAKTMPLTAGMELKPIAVTAGGWKPSSIGRNAGAAPGAKDGYMDPEMVQRKVKAALNKMTPENFEKISDQILAISAQSKDETDGRTLRQVIQLTFEKATDEAHWASMYAKFCKKMLENISPDIQDERVKDRAGAPVSGGGLFRKYLLNRCQVEFERGWKQEQEANKAAEDAAEAQEANKKPGEVEMLSDEYYAAAAAKRRGLGLVQFIGELYKLGMLTERIMIECVHKLVDNKGVPDEAEIESLSKLLRTIGQNLDMSEKGRPMMDVYFQRIQGMVDMPELPSRMKFMLMDVVDLRRANWQSKETNKGPKTLDEVRAEAEAAQAAKAQESARGNQRGGGGRPPVGRGDARNFSAGYQQTSNQVGMDDLRRLKGTANRTTSGNVTLGPTSMFSSRSNSGRRLGPGGSLGRGGEESGASSRTGTPPVRDNPSHSNAFRCVNICPC